MMKLYGGVAVLAAIGLSGCMASGPTPVSYAPAPTPVPSVQMTWVRTDGQSGRANPALADQFAADRASCNAASEDNRVLEAARGCMSDKGYVLVPASEAASTAARFRQEQAAKLNMRG